MDPECAKWDASPPISFWVISSLPAMGTEPMPPPSAPSGVLHPLFLLPLSLPARHTAGASPSAVAYSCVLTLRLCPNLLESVCAVHPPLPTLLKTSLGLCWLWWLLGLSTWLSTGHLPAQHVNLVTSSWSPTQSLSCYLRWEFLALTIKASNSELRYWLIITTFIFCL